MFMRSESKHQIYTTVYVYARTVHIHMLYIFRAYIRTCSYIYMYEQQQNSYIPIKDS